MSELSSPLPELTRRQEDILSLIIRAYTQTPEPVSSKSLTEGYDLGISSATVRNEMARLEEMGYIAAPHTSAGRVPTVQGYRYVVRSAMDKNGLTPSDHQYIETKFKELPLVLEQWLRQAAKVLTRTVHTASLVTPPLSQNNRFKHIELISIQGRLTLMVLVLQGGVVHQRMLTLAEPVSQEKLSDVALYINSLCNDCTAIQLRLKRHQTNELEREIIDLAADLMDRSSGNQVRVVYRDGLSEVISDFSDNKGAQQAIRVFEERAFLDMILTEILQPLIDEQQVQVVIAGDGREEISHLSLVLSRYGVPGQISGTLGIVGPTNINYGRAISAVRHVSTLMTDMLIDLYDDSQNTRSDDAL